MPASSRRAAEKAVQASIELSIGARRPAMRAFRTSTLEQRGEALAIRVRPLRTEPLQPACFREQTLAPALDRVHAGLLRIRRVGPLREPRPDRRRIDLAHQTADELQLPSTRFVPRDAAGGVERVDETLGQIELRETGRAHVEQRFAEALQSVHFGFAAGFRGSPGLLAGR